MIRTAAAAQHIPMPASSAHHVRWLPQTTLCHRGMFLGPLSPGVTHLSLDLLARGFYTFVLNVFCSALLFCLFGFCFVLRQSVVDM